jgi:hypothetical protein
MIEARIAAVGPVGPIRLHHEDDRGAVRVLLAGEAGQLDDDVGLVDDAAEEILGAFGGRREGFEVLLGLEDDLLGSHGAARMPAHAVRQHGHQRALAGRVRKDRGAILLLATVARVLRHTGLGLVTLLRADRFGRGQG